MKNKYKGDNRYEEVYKKMLLLNIKDVSTTRQEKNGTIVWRLPIKYSTHNKFIEVASFKTGYVRNQNGGYTNYQLNKRIVNEVYYPEYKWNEAKNMSVKTGKHYKSGVKSCILIPKEIDRLEYLISYCLKNYYIKKANEVINGNYVAKWYHEYQLERFSSNKVEELQNRIYYLEEKLDAMTEDRDYKVEVLENKLSNAISPTKYESVKRELSAIKVRQDVSVIVNGHRYKVL